MQLTVCICTHNRAHYVRDCLAGLAGQTAERGTFAVLIVDSGSSDETHAELLRLAAAFGETRLLRLEQPGVSSARNAGAWACHTTHIAYIDDDAVPAPDWVASILDALREAPRPPIVLGGRVLPRWEAPLPPWWPPDLRGVLSIIEAQGQGEFGDPDLPRNIGPYGVNMVVHVLSLLAIGGFAQASGRYGAALLSDEDVQLAWRLQRLGHSVRYDSRIVVHHQIQATRLTPEWLLSRLYWQGASTVLTHRLLGQPGAVWRELPRRLAVALLFAPAALLPRSSTRLIALRWRLAYALGFVRATFGWHADQAAQRLALAPVSRDMAPV